MREVRRGGRKDTFVGRSVISVVVITGASTYATKVEVELFLWIDVVRIHDV